MHEQWLGLLFACFATCQSPQTSLCQICICEHLLQTRAEVDVYTAISTSICLQGVVGRSEMLSLSNNANTQRKWNKNMRILRMLIFRIFLCEFFINKVTFNKSRHFISKELLCCHMPKNASYPHIASHLPVQNAFLKCAFW